MIPLIVKETSREMKEGEKKPPPRKWNEFLIGAHISHFPDDVLFDKSRRMYAKTRLKVALFSLIC